MTTRIKTHNTVDWTKVQIDPEDEHYKNEFPWSLDGRGYIGCLIRGKIGYTRIRLHQLICPVEDGFEVDHVDMNPLNLKRSNLRQATRQQNHANRRVQKNNELGYKGIRQNGNGFLARITVSRKTHCLGTYKTIEEAVQAYNKAAIKHYGEFARLSEV